MIARLINFETRKKHEHFLQNIENSSFEKSFEKLLSIHNCTALQQNKITIPIISTNNTQTDNVQSNVRQNKGLYNCMQTHRLHVTYKVSPW